MYFLRRGGLGRETSATADVTTIQFIRKNISFGVRSSTLRQSGALFRNFADLNTTQASFDAFASAFGNLWAGIELASVDETGRLVLRVMDEASAKRGYTDWCREILAVRECVRLWDLVRADDDRSLSQVIQWRPEAGGNLAVFHECNPAGKGDDVGITSKNRKSSVIASSRTDPLLLMSLKPGDLRIPAVICIQKSINGRLEDSKNLRPSVHASVFRTPDGKLYRHFVPKTFLVGLWLQFAQAVEENKDYGKCKECGTWFEISLQGEGKRRERRTREYCSDSCKIKRYQDRKENAVRLSKRGQDLKEIAEKLGTDTNTVRRWIEEEK